MFSRKLVVRRVIALGTTILSAASSGAALEFDHLDEAAVKFEKVLAIVDGKVVFNLNEQGAPERQVAIPFRYVLNNYQVPNVNSLIFLDERGEIIFKDVALSGISYPTTYFPARDGRAYLTMEGLCRPPGLYLNAFPETKRLYSSEGRLIWEKRAEGYPRVSPNGDYVAVFFASDFHGRITLIDKDGNASEVEGPVGPFHATSKEGDFLLVGETPYVPSDWLGGTTVYSATGKVITHLDPNFACRSALLIGDYNIYGSRNIIVQTGFFIKRRDGVDPHGNSVTDTDHPKSERGIQVYDGKGRKLWERKLGGGHPGLQFFVSDNEKYIALIPDPAAGITVFESETGKIVRTIKTRRIPSSIHGGYVSNDGEVVLLTYQCCVKSGDYDTGAVIFRGDSVVAEIRLAGSVNGRLSGNITPVADMLLLNNHREAAVYRLDWLR
jgi:hypothetical protein